VLVMVYLGALAEPVVKLLSCSCLTMSVATVLVLLPDAAFPSRAPGADAPRPRLPSEGEESQGRFSLGQDWRCEGCLH
jgi:hypothetical protein